MTVFKHEYPILEYDTEKNGIIIYLHEKGSSCWLWSRRIISRCLKDDPRLNN